MFALPALAVAPVVNSVGVGTVPVLDGALYGWALIAALVIATFGILRASLAEDFARAGGAGRSSRTPPTAPRLRIVDTPSKVAA